jgi:protein-S-isoprenylcysteine O-methyltransferase Ste14
MNKFGTLFEIVNFSILGAFLISEICINIFLRGDKARAKPVKGRISNAVIMTVGLSTIVLGTAIGFLAKFRDIRWLFSPNYAISAFGLLLILVGVVIRWSAILELRKFFTVDVKILKDHKLIRSGLFRYVRHPSYFGLLLSVLGLGITMVNWLSTLVMLVPHIIIILMRIKEEEGALTQRFGADYRKYCRETKRLVPRIY